MKQKQKLLKNLAEIPMRGKSKQSLKMKEIMAKFNGEGKIFGRVESDLAVDPRNDERQHFSLKDSEEEETIPEAPRPPSRKRAPKNSRVVYNIKDVIELMRRLPKGEMQVVAAVVRETLESTNISVSGLIEDAEEREAHIRENVSQLGMEIKKYQELIHERDARITELQTDLSETREVREHLSMGSRKKRKPHEDYDSTPIVKAVP